MLYYCIGRWNRMLLTYIESATALSDYEEHKKFAVFVRLQKVTSRAYLDPEM